MYQPHLTSNQQKDAPLGRRLVRAIPLWGVTLALLLGLLLLAPTGVLAQAGGPTVRWPSLPSNSGQAAPLPMPFLEGAQVFYDDLKVSSGDVYEGDVVVYNGNAEVEGGGRIGGALFVYSGDIDIKGGGTVNGDVIAYGGDVEIHGGGSVGGTVQALGGDVALQDGSSVAGDVSVLGGEIERSAGAEVGGNVLSGPHLQIPALPNLPGLTPLATPGLDQIAPSSRGGEGLTNLRQSGFSGWLWRLVLNLFKAGFFTLFMVLGSALVLKARPGIVGDAQEYLESDPRSAFGVGLLANMVVMIPLWMWLGSLNGNWFTILCLTPLLLPLGLVALAIELAGLATFGGWLGKRLAKEAGFNLSSQAATALAVILTVGASGLLWAFSACLGWLALLFAGAPGIGALVLHWRSRRHDGSTPGPVTLPPSPAPTTPPVVPVVPAEAAPLAQVEPVQLDLTAPEAGGVVEGGADFDFTTLGGIGPVFSMRLRAANVRTLGDLAGMSDESLADVLNVSVDRVVRDDILGQARRLMGLE